MNVYAEKSQSATIDPVVNPVINQGIAPLIAVPTAGREETRSSSISDSYQKVLDYHIAEIFLTTIVFGVIILLRLHH
jgi:hypothetical protein